MELDITPEPKQKAKPRGKPFEKGNTLGFPKGTSGNYAGRPKGTITKLSVAYGAQLEEKLPASICDVWGYDPNEPPTWAEAIAAGLARAAATGDTAAAKEIREVTEGKLPDKLKVEGKIDYTAGKAAKDVLLDKLLPKGLVNGDPTTGSEQG